MKTTMPNPWPGLSAGVAFIVPSGTDCDCAQYWLTKARERLLDAFGKSTDPAPLLRLIEDLAIVQERLSAIKE